MKIEDIKTINDIKTIKEQSDKEIKHLEEEFKELEQAYNEKLLSKEEYNNFRRRSRRNRKNISCGRYGGKSIQSS